LILGKRRKEAEAKGEGSFVFTTLKKNVLAKGSFTGARKEQMWRVIRMEKE